MLYIYNIHWLLHIHCLSPSAYICPMPVTIGVYLSNACHYRRIFVQCLSLSAYISPMPVTIGVYLSNACHYQPISVQCLSEITDNFIISYVFYGFGTQPRIFRICRKWTICSSSGPPQQAPGVRMTWVLTNSLKKQKNKPSQNTRWNFPITQRKDLDITHRQRHAIHKYSRIMLSMTADIQHHEMNHFCC